MFPVHLEMKTNDKSQHENRTNHKSIILHVSLALKHKHTHIYTIIIIAKLNDGGQGEI